MVQLLFDRLQEASDASDNVAVHTFREVTSDLSRLGLNWSQLGKLIGGRLLGAEDEKENSSQQKRIAQASFGEILNTPLSFELNRKESEFVRGVEKFWVKHRYVTDKQVVSICEIFKLNEYREAVDLYAGYARPEWVAEYKYQKNQKIVGRREAEEEKRRILLKKVSEMQAVLAPLKISTTQTNFEMFERWKTLVKKLPYEKTEPRCEIQNYRSALNGAGSKQGRVGVALMVKIRPSELFARDSYKRSTDNYLEDDLLWLSFLSQE
ncbi:hypothetical protein ABIE64_004180 [Thalassospira sp. MBR-102]|uniref:hypothetical protein n=1 Tax=Thalassospira sp. MBR-102 TaxID=3156466 RepID=UPI00339B44A8